MDVKEEISIAKDVITRDDTKCSVYPWSNEFLKLYYNLHDLSGKNVLCITGSGDHPLHAALAGAEKIDAVDINPLAKRYAELKSSLIKAFEHRNFFRQFESYSPFDTFNVMQRNVPIRYLKRLLSNDTYYLWKEVLDFSNGKKFKNLFRADGFDYYNYVFCLAYENKQAYESLRKRINSGLITYHDDSIERFMDHANHKYGAIYLSNVIEKLPKNSREALIDKSVSLLSSRGVVYSYQMDPETPTYGDDMLAGTMSFEKYGSPSKLYVYKK